MLKTIFEHWLKLHWKLGSNLVRYSLARAFSPKILLDKQLLHCFTSLLTKLLPEGGGHWGILETAKPKKKKSSKTAKLPKNRSKPKTEYKPRWIIKPKNRSKTENRMLKNEKSANCNEPAKTEESLLATAKPKIPLPPPPPHEASPVRSPC